MANRFWHQKYIQPKRQFKFIAEVAGGNLIYPYLVRKVTRPELTMPEKQHKILGHEFQFPVGTQQWNVVNIEFMDIARDYLDNDQTEENAAIFLQDAIRASGYVYPNSMADATIGLTKGKAVTAMGSLKIYQLDADNTVLETFRFKNPFITKVNFGGDFDYNAEEFVMPNIDIRYDWAEIVPGYGGRKGQQYGEMGAEAERAMEAQGLAGNSRQA